MFNGAKGLRLQAHSPLTHRVNPHFNSHAIQKALKTGLRAAGVIGGGLSSVALTRHVINLPSTLCSYVSSCYLLALGFLPNTSLPQNFINTIVFRCRHRHPLTHSTTTYNQPTGHRHHFHPF